MGRTPTACSYPASSICRSRNPDGELSCRGATSTGSAASCVKRAVTSTKSSPGDRLRGCGVAKPGETGPGTTTWPATQGPHSESFTSLRMCASKRYKSPATTSGRVKCCSARYRRTAVSRQLRWIPYSAAVSCSSWISSNSCRGQQRTVPLVTSIWGIT